MNLKRIAIGVATVWTVLSLGAIVYFILAARRVEPRTGEAGAPFQPVHRGRSVVTKSSQVDPELGRLLYRYFPKPLSANFEEVFIRDYFQDQRNGFFLDVGASHFRDRSTTHYVDVALGWSGIAIDAIAEFAEGYARHRPRTKFFAILVSDTSDENVDFYVNTDDSKKSTARRELADTFQHTQTRKIQTTTLDDLLDSQGVKTIDLLSMDIELWEPQALAGFDIDRFKPKLVVIESHPPVRDQIYRYFAEHGYAEIDKYTKWDGSNAYFVPAEDLPAFLARQPSA